MSSSSTYKTESSFHAAITAYFNTKLGALYGRNFSSINFVSRTTTGKNSDRYVLTFRAYFTRAVTDIAQRTAVITNIQTAYYEVLTRFFQTAAKTMTVPKTAKIATPKAVDCSSKKAILTKKSDSTQSLTSGTQIKLTALTSSEQKSTCRDTSEKFLFF